MKDKLINLLMAIFRCLPINKSKILFMSYYGANYGCNPKYLSEYICNNYPDKFKVVWSFLHPAKFKGYTGIRKVKYNGLKHYFHLATAGTIVHNYRMPSTFRKRNGQLYIQCWHSSLRLKKIEGDVEHSLKSDYLSMAKSDSKQIDLLISGCKFSTQIFQRAFWFDGKILEYGTPRADVFFRPSNLIKNKVYKHYNISRDSKILLYAPTFRNNNSLQCYNLDFNKIVNVLSNRFDGHWVVAIRLHPHLQDLNMKWKSSDSIDIYNVSKYDDIQELLCASDALITDYSSLMFDFMFTQKPMWLYASDIESYIKNERGLYFNIEDLPIPLARNNEELVDNIRMFNPDSYLKDLAKFQDNVGNYENGTASEKIIDEIIKIKEL